MKKFLIAVVCALILTPMMVFAEAEARDLLETFEAAGITPSISDYKETDDQITLYLFWWVDCGNCHNELNFLNEILGDYKDKIKLRSYEVTESKENSNLREKVGDFFDVNGTGVPLLIVGESSFYGFPDSVKEKIKTAIDNEYAKAKEDRYDLFKALEEGKKEIKKSYTNLYIFAGIAIVGIVGFFGYIVIKK